MSLPIHSHRDGVATACPSCEFKQDGIDWLMCRVETHSSAKKGTVAVVSRCPRCGERSWAHFNEPTYLELVNGGYIEQPEQMAVLEAQP